MRNGFRKQKGQLHWKYVLVLHLHQLSRPSHVRITAGFSVYQMDYSPVGESTTFRYGNCQAKYFENVFPTSMLLTVL
jgi:hypothetical protein